MDHLIRYALMLGGAHAAYRWGGDDPIAGFDCSGFVSELMQAAGVFPNKQRLNAQGIHENLIYAGAREVWAPGAIAFYGPSIDQIDHVNFCLSQQLCVGYMSGDSSTINDQAAEKMNAFFKLRPIKYRKDFLCVLMPNYSFV